MFRDSRWVGCLCLALLASSAQAQTANRSPGEIGEMIKAVLQAVIPPKEPPGSRPIADVAGREILLDYHHTMTAFGLADSADVRAKLGLAPAVAEGSMALLEGCDQRGIGPCERLGRSAYVSMEPISISDSIATVRVQVAWSNTFPSKPSKRTYLAAWTTEVTLTRSGSGPWMFLKLGRSVIS